MMKAVLLVDDHPAVRASLKNLMHTRFMAENIYEAGSSDEGLEMALRYTPELIVMDISLCGTSGIDLTKKIMNRLPDTKIVMLSMYSKVIYITESLKAGAKGYILKEADMDSIINGIHKVMNGETYVDSKISGKVISTLLSPESPDILIPDSNSYDTLTLREQEILRMLAEGQDIKDIASELCISVKTAINHRTNIMQKLNCRNMVELIKYAIHIGLVDA